MITKNSTYENDRTLCDCPVCDDNISSGWVKIAQGEEENE